jgi:hypothetical protein
MYSVLSDIFDYFSFKTIIDEVISCVHNVFNFDFQNLDEISL